MLKKIYLELVAIKEELRLIRRELRTDGCPEAENTSNWISGRMEKGELYAGGRLYKIKIVISLSGDDWYKLQKKRFYKKLERYLSKQREKGERQLRLDGAGGAPGPKYMVPCPPKPKRE